MKLIRLNAMLVFLWVSGWVHAESAQVCLMRVEDAAEDLARCGSNCDQAQSVLEEKKQACRESGFTESALTDATETGKQRVKATTVSASIPLYKPKVPARSLVIKSVKDQNASNFARLLPGIKANSLQRNYNAGNCHDAYLGDGTRFVYVGKLIMSGSAKDPSGASVRLFVVKMEKGECYPSAQDKKDKFGAAAVYNLPLSLLDMWKRGEGVRRTPFSSVRVGDLRVTYCSSVIKCSHLMR